MQNLWSDPAFYSAVLWKTYIPIIAFGWVLIWLRGRRLNVYLTPLLMFGWALFVVWLLGVVTRWGHTVILLAALVAALTPLQWFILTPLMLFGVFALVWVSSRVYVRPWVFVCGMLAWFSFCTFLLWLTGYFHQA